MLAVLLVALSVGLDNLGAATAIGVSGVDQRLRLRIAIVFGAFEAAMPVVGLLLGNAVSHHIDNKGKVLAGSVLCLTGLFALVSAARSSDTERRRTNYPTGRLLLLGAALSIDNLAIGFALGTYQVSLPVAAIIIGAVSVTMSLIGLELGHRLGTKTGERGELLGGLVLIAVGIAIASGIR